MTQYDVVFVLDADLPQDTITSLKADVLAMLKNVGTVHAEDDIGVMDVQPNPEKKERLYYLSVHFEHDGSKIDDLKKQLGITKGVNRSFFYKLSANEPFLLYSDVVKRVETIIDVEEERAAEAEESDDDAADQSDA